METFFASGRAADLLLLVLAAEAAWWIARGRRDRLPRLAAAAGLVLALRIALTGGWWGWIALALMGAGAAHAWDRARG